MHSQRIRARQAYTDAVRRTLIGPLFGEEEVLTLSRGGVPRDLYTTGVLYPLIIRGQGSAETPSAGEGELGGDEEWSDTGDEAPQQPTHVTAQHARMPSTMGLSFVIEVDGDAPAVLVELEAGRYELVDDAPTDASDESAEAIWRRTNISVRQVIRVEQASNKVEGLEGLRWYTRVTQHPTDARKRQVTLILIHDARVPAADYDLMMEEALFQARFRVSAHDDCLIAPRMANTTQLSRDRLMQALLYRDQIEWAVGHTCSASWSFVDDDPKQVVIETRWIPTHRVQDMNPSGSQMFSQVNQERFSDPGRSFDAGVLATASGGELTRLLEVIPDVYEAWLREQEERLGQIHDPKLAELAVENIARAEDVARRLREGISTLEQHPFARTAFQLAQRALTLQYRWRSGDDASRLVWRPFQLAFQLLCLTGIVDGDRGVDPAHPDRDVMDLLWFPTGGGKTEAYLGLTAMTIFARRLRDPASGGGVTVLMRYTLRLLTMQQFERASRLILACESIRREKAEELGHEPISIGLWVGRSTTPNSVKEAREAGAMSARQLARCPVCGSESSLEWDARPDTPDHVLVCTNPTCSMSGELPIHTIDEMVYRARPSLVIGTVDKFAQIVRNAQTTALFGGMTFAPPELIIQDELHLISGPLGTVVGLYETAIDMICVDEARGRRAKVVGSTATIRNADEQVRALFDRELCQFPPAVLDASDSCFARVDEDAPGRLYLGLSSAGRSPKYTFQHACGALMYHASPDAQTLAKDEVDPYWTLVAYFNTLRELGGALVMMYDDVQSTIDGLANMSNTASRRDMAHLELSSRIDATDIPEYILALERRYPDQDISVALATNMISVGVDIPRLGLMVINGQPKSMAEYIQASARVGRNQIAGVVLTVLNHRRARDRAHFESFKTLHQRLYSSVEPVSVTPFSARARDRGLHAVLIALARHLLPRRDPRAAELAHTPKLTPELYELLRDLVADIAARAERATPDDPDIAVDVIEECEAFLEDWLRADVEHYWNDFKPGNSLLVSAEEFAKDVFEHGMEGSHGLPTLNSMRNVEPSCSFRLRDGKQRRQRLQIKV